jgi:trehalose 6-phosphate phosphatase
MREILQSIKPSRRLFFFLDYDGTLVPIARTPERAVLNDRRRRILNALGETAFLCIVSGRSLDEVRRLVGLDGLAYIGNHGLETCWGRKTWIHPLARQRMPALGRLLKRIADRTERMPRLLLENKGVTASIHYRRLDSALVPLLKVIVGETVGRKTREFLVTEGKKVLEIRPRVGEDKGTGIRRLMSWLPPGRNDLRIGIGDDRTDEDAFRELGPAAVTIHVGARKSEARYRLADVDQVWEFLRDCLRLSLQKK